MYQKVMIVGRLSADPTFKVHDGTDCASFTVVSQIGNHTPLWADVTVWGYHAANTHKYLEKGSVVLITGRPKLTAFIAKDGVARANLAINADNVTFLPSAQRQAEPENELAPDNELPF